MGERSDTETPAEGNVTQVREDGIERRIVGLAPEVREAEGDGESPGGFRGYAAVYNELSVPLGMFLRFREKIAPGAFDEAIREDDVRFLLGHDDHPASVLARRVPGREGNTLSLASDDRGLLSDVAALPNVEAARHLVESVKRRDVDQMSFGFRVLDDEWDDEPDGDKTDLPIRTLKKVRLYDVSPVAFPAYPQTSAEVRSHVQALAQARAEGGVDLDSTEAEEEAGEETESEDDRAARRRRFERLARPGIAQGLR